MPSCYPGLNTSVIASSYWQLKLQHTPRQKLSMLYSGLDNPKNSPFPWGDLKISTPSNTWFFGPLESAPSCFCTVHQCNRQTHRHTDHATCDTCYVMWCDLKKKKIQFQPEPVWQLELPSWIYPTTPARDTRCPENFKSKCSIPTKKHTYMFWLTRLLFCNYPTFVPFRVPKNIRFGILWQMFLAECLHNAQPAMSKYWKKLKVQTLIKENHLFASNPFLTNRMTPHHSHPTDHKTWHNQ